MSMTAAEQIKVQKMEERLAGLEERLKGFMPTVLTQRVEAIGAKANRAEELAHGAAAQINGILSETGAPREPMPPTPPPKIAEALGMVERPKRAARAARSEEGASQ